MSRDDPGDAAVTTPPAIAVEVLSPSSRSIDAVLTRGLYEQAGIALYRLVDLSAPRAVTGTEALGLDALLRVRLVPQWLQSRHWAVRSTPPGRKGLGGP